MKWIECVIDATLGIKYDTFCFCPIEGSFPDKFDIVVGMNYLSSVPPKDLKLVGIVHQDGEKAVNQFCEKNKELLEQLKKDMED